MFLWLFVITFVKNCIGLQPEYERETDVENASFAAVVNMPQYLWFTKIYIAQGRIQITSRQGWS